MEGYLTVFTNFNIIHAIYMVIPLIGACPEEILLHVCHRCLLAKIGNLNVNYMEMLEQIIPKTK